MEAFALILVLVGFFFYFLPCIVLHLRGGDSMLVAAVNLLAGWTVIGWFAALIMAFAVKVKA